ncbi:type IV pilus assembly protein PilW [Candidatus Magnetomoraceae bacterium gMMP-15]
MPFLFFNKNQGFTLVEFMIAMTIGLILLELISSTFFSQRKTYDVQQNVAGMVRTARAVMDIMSREIRMAGYDPTGAGFDGIVYDTEKLKISADLNGNGSTDDIFENITYFYDNINFEITKNTGTNVQVLAENIQLFDFVYLDDDGNETTSAQSIRQIKITIITRTASPDPDYPDNNGYRTKKFISYVKARNLKS